MCKQLKDQNFVTDFHDILKNFKYIPTDASEAKYLTSKSASSFSFASVGFTWENIILLKNTNGIILF